MEFCDVVEVRKSVRNYLPRSIDESLIEELIAVAKKSPMAGNRQRDREFIAITDKAVIAEIADATERRWQEIVDGLDGFIKEELCGYVHNFSWFRGVPCLLAVVVRQEPSFLGEAIGTEMARRVYGSEMSAALAVENLVLSATNKGLGSCVLTGPLASEDELKTILGLKGKQRLCAFITIGYEDEQK